MLEFEVSGSGSCGAKLGIRWGKHTHIAAYRMRGEHKGGWKLTLDSQHPTPKFCDAAVFQKVLAVYLLHRGVDFAPESQELMEKA